MTVPKIHGLGLKPVEICLTTKKFKEMEEKLVQSGYEIYNWDHFGDYQEAIKNRI